MALYIVLVIMFLLSLGAVLSATMAEKLSIGDRPPIYADNGFVTIINLFIIPMLILFIILMFLNWKTTLIISLIGWIFGGWTLKPIAEVVIISPIYKILKRR